MSITNYISDCLNLKDKNLIIYDKTYIKKIKNRNVRIIEGRITYTPSYCPKCDCVCNGFNDVNNAVAEGTNNLIKCVKRIGFGYRKFNHLKARVILVKQGIDIRNYSY